MARHTRNPLLPRLAVGALGITLLGVGTPAAHAATAGETPDQRPGPAARAAGLPPALPTRSAAPAEAITDVWGRGSGAPPRPVR